MDAEREAAKIVQKAKQCKKDIYIKGVGGDDSKRGTHMFFVLDRVQRLKDARSEAAKEIEELKAQKNAEYQDFVAQVCLLFKCICCCFI